MRGFLPVAMCALLLSGCGHADVETIQAQVAEAYFVEPEEAVFSDVYQSGEATCGFVAGRVKQDDYEGRRPFLVEGDGQAMEIMSDEHPIDFLIRAARFCPKEFGNVLQEEGGESLVNDIRQAAGMDRPND